MSDRKGQRRRTSIAAAVLFASVLAEASFCRATGTTVDVLNAANACAFAPTSTLSKETKDGVRQQIANAAGSGQAMEGVATRIVDIVLKAALASHDFEPYDRYVACLQARPPNHDSAAYNGGSFVLEHSPSTYLDEGMAAKVAKKFDEAVIPFEHAASLNDSDAELALGVLYGNGSPGFPSKPEHE